jgi:hypothetical protein
MRSESKMNKLYMIRLENGDSAVLQAASEEDAIQKAGLRADPTELAAELTNGDVALVHLGMIKAGVGPQNFTIRELHDFMCIAALREDGDFDFRLESDEALDEFFLDYPAIEAAADENSKMDLTQGGLDNPTVQELFRDAVEQERARLLVAPSSSARALQTSEKSCGPMGELDF